MSLPLPFVTPLEPVHRIGRKPDPWRPIDWAYADEDRTFGNRFDDSEGYFRVLYAGSNRLGCFIETLSRFRRPLLSASLTSDLDEIVGSTSDYSQPGTLPVSWFAKRMIGSAFPAGARYADIYSSEWIAYLRKEFEHDPALPSEFRLGEAQLDLSVLMSQHRRLTQKAATIVYKQGYDGIFYASRHGSDLSNWALFEPFRLSDVQHVEINSEEANFKEAARRLDLVLDLTR